MRKKKIQAPTDAAPVASYKHEDKRVRIPTQEESVKLSAREKQPVKKKYEYDPSLDPQLIWSGKKEAGVEFEVASVPIYVQEKIAPEAIIARLKAGTNETSQMLLFGETAQEQFGKAVEFYKHEDNWQNRMILGDSLLVMNSLLEKEGMRGKVQTIYIDPPYGIKFGSNWQVSTRKPKVKDNKLEDFIRQPEQVKAFRDTWELGIHSYLSYLRDRLITARELLTESGSCFVQISDENVHLVRNIMDEVFGNSNFASLIMFKTTSGLGQKLLDKCGDYILWYAKNIERVKYRQLYQEKTDDNITNSHKILLTNDEVISIKQYEKRFLNDGKISLTKLKIGEKIFNYGDVKSQSGNGGVVIINSKTYTTAMGSWKTTEEGFNKLYQKGRIKLNDKSFNYIRYFDDFSYISLNNMWSNQLSESDKDYVVQTSTEVIKRCILMTTDPGDLVLDPTCGSGTTAFVAEQWGRRWITVDTSRVALALARIRLMTAKFSYYKLKEKDNVRYGFECKIVPHITLKSLANDESAEQEVLYDQPFEDKNIVRVTGPFTV